MTNFEEITKDTESLAKFITLATHNDCCYCIAQTQCEKLQQTGDTYRLCVRSWCAWLNKEY